MGRGVTNILCKTSFTKILLKMSPTHFIECSDLEMYRVTQPKAILFLQNSGYRVATRLYNHYPTLGHVDCFKYASCYWRRDYGVYIDQVTPLCWWRVLHFICTTLDVASWWPWKEQRWRDSGNDYVMEIGIGKSLNLHHVTCVHACTRYIYIHNQAHRYTSARTHICTNVHYT